MNFIIDLSPSTSYDSILVVVDHLMKMTRFISCTKTITSEGASKLFFDDFFSIMVFLKISFSIVGFSLHASFGSNSLSF
jgi:hypothetical protein